MTERTDITATRATRRRRKTEKVEGARHGTTTGYTADACRCDECFAAIRRYQDEFATRRANGSYGDPA